MRGMTLENIVAAVEGEVFMPEHTDTISAPTDHEEGSGAADLRKAAAGAAATAVVIDSRKVEPGAVFVAVKGERADGHDYIGQVFTKGAMCVICEHLPEAKEDFLGPCIVVGDSLIALKKLAKFYRRQMSDVQIVGIVGSVGKTSTKELVASVLEQKYCTLKTEGNFNNEIGVPLTIFRLRDEHRMAVVEMGISDFNEMDRLGDIVKPNAVVMTNIGPCHLEKLGDLDGVLHAKSEVFSHIEEGGLLVLNSADKKLCSVIERRNGYCAESRDKAGNVSISCSAHELRDDVRIVSYGEGGNVRAEKIKSLGLEGTEFTVLCSAMPEITSNENAGAGQSTDTDTSFFETKVPLPGIHMVWNALAATAVGREFGLSDEEIARGIEAVKPVSGRSNLIRTEKYLIVDDCYNANPKSMKAAIDLMQDALGRRCAILGDMFELGEQEAQLHTEVGTYAAEHNMDLLICVGSLSKNMYDAAVAVNAAPDTSALSGLDAVHDDKNCEIRYFETLTDMPKNPAELGLKEGDTILVKASHGMQFGMVVELLKNA